MEPEAIEIPPPSRSGDAWSSKKEEIAPLKVINLDDDEDDDVVVVIGGTNDRLKKGKAVMDYSNGYGNAKDGLTDNAFSYYCEDDVEIINDVKQIKKKGIHAPAEVEINKNKLCSYDDDNMELECPGFAFMKGGHNLNFLSEKYVDEYDKLQSHFDSMDIPTGVEVPIPWWDDISQSHGQFSAGSIAAGSNSKTSTLQNASVNPALLQKKFDLSSSSGSQGQPGSLAHPFDVDLAIPLSLTPTGQGQGKKSRAPSPDKGVNKSFSFGLESFRARRLLEPFWNKKMNNGSSSSGKLSYVKSSNAMNMPAAADPLKNEGGALGSGSVPNNLSHTYKNVFLPKAGAFTPFTATSTMNAWWQGPSEDSFSPHPIPYESYHGYVEPLGSSVHVIPKEEDGSGLQEGLLNEDDIMHKFQLFKRFDMVQELSDHYFSGKGSTAKHQSNEWLKGIQEEWKILEKNLPDSIFVRAYETRMDLLRAVIVGAEGTPYHDGLFFFDIYFPPEYPNVPPHVHYHSGGLRINPNLYGCGKVCLSLLNTWSGQHVNERWIPGTSTMLQVLVSIQGLILNAKPYFNEPGFACQMGTPNGERTSLKYNEDTYVLSLRTMLYTTRRPPEHFKDFVIGHFWKQAHDIMAACQAYVRGAQVGLLVGGSPQKAVNEVDKNCCSSKFKDTVASYIGLLSKAFAEIGVKDCERYVPTPDRTVPVMMK